MCSSDLIRTGLTPYSVMRLRGTDTIVVAIDDGSARRLSADATFYPPVPQVFALDWDLAEREPSVGWEWVALGQNELPPRKPRGVAPNVLVSMGGADPLGLTMPAVRALAGLNEKMNVTVVLGPSAPPELEDKVAKAAPQFRVRRNPKNMPQLMAGADIALVTFGVTAYELGAMGVPAIYIPLNEDHAASASAFVKAGMGVSLGTPASLTEGQVGEAVLQLLEDEELRRSMSAAGRMNLDGRGAARIAARITQLLEERAAAFAPQPGSKVAAA